MLVFLGNLLCLTVSFPLYFLLYTQRRDDLNLAGFEYLQIHLYIYKYEYGIDCIFEMEIFPDCSSRFPFHNISTSTNNYHTINNTKLCQTGCNLLQFLTCKAYNLYFFKNFSNDFLYPEKKKRRTGCQNGNFFFIF